MRTGKKKRLNKTRRNTQMVVYSELGLPPTIFWKLLTHFAGYRQELLITEVVVFPDGAAYYVCPRCKITLEREFVSFCDRCGQHLGWNRYKEAKIIHPGRRNEINN